MNIEVKRSELLHALAAADGIARPNGPMPLLECVLITAHGRDKVTVDATDTTMTISAEIASVNRDPGSIALNAKRLRDVIKNAPAGDVSIATIENAWVEIKAGKARYKLAGIHGRDFPKIQKAKTDKVATFDAGVLKQMIDRVLFSTSDDMTRIQLHGALFSSASGVASMVTTDGHRMSKATCSHDATFAALVPKETLAKIARIVEGDTEIIVEPGRIFVRTAGLILSSPLIDAVFPPIEQVVPKEFAHVITVDREALIASIERTKIATSQTRGTNLDGRRGVLVVSSDNSEVGTVSDEVDADGATDKITTCAAPKYLLEPLARFSDEFVKIKIGGELDPIVIEGATSRDYMALSMPMRRN